MPTVRVVRPFANGHHDRIVHPGDEITVSEDRASELGDLVERITVAKAAPVPFNKMAPAPENKAVPPSKRRGRPAKVRA